MGTKYQNVRDSEKAVLRGKFVKVSTIQQSNFIL